MDSTGQRLPSASPCTLEILSRSVLNYDIQRMIKNKLSAVIVAQTELPLLQLLKERRGEEREARRMEVGKKRGERHERESEKKGRHGERKGGDFRPVRWCRSCLKVQCWPAGC